MQNILCLLIMIQKLIDRQGAFFCRIPENRSNDAERFLDDAEKKSQKKTKAAKPP